MTNLPMLSVELFEAIDQWRLERMQLVNWGSFHGYHSVDFDPRATLISGPSGSGKSTLLDAYTALMMDSATPFNGASNEGKGRARGKEQRSILSYIRGALDTVTDRETGELVDAVLRGRATATWSAIAGTFRNDDGAAFTALRLYFVRAGASTASDVTMRLMTMTGTLNLMDVEKFAVERFTPRHLTTRYPSLKNHESYDTFSQALYTRLGIGLNGDGARALKLLSRIQGGQQVTTVDALYKGLVLERPETYDKADLVISHFDDLAKTHEAMQTAAQKVESLKPIVGLHEDMMAAQVEREAIDAYRINTDGPTPFLLWRLLTERTMLDDAVETNRAARADAKTRRDLTKAEEQRLSQLLEQNKADQLANGGEALERFKERLADLADERATTAAELLRFTERTLALGDAAVDSGGFEELAREAQDFLSSYAEREDAVTEKRDDVIRQGVVLQDERAELAKEHESLKGRKTMLPRRYLEARAVIAAAADMDPAKLPFVAELVDLLPEHERWRQTAELVMRSFATVMLVDERDVAHLRRCIDSVPTRDRIHFQAVPTGLSGAAATDGTLAATLQFAESPFTGWLRQEVARRYGHERVETARDFLDDDRPRVTLSGQVQDGNRGSHGGRKGEFILGFSNEKYLRQIGQRLRGLDEQLAALHQQKLDYDGLGRSLRQRREAYLHVIDTTWPQIDVASVDARIADTEAERERLRATQDKLAALEKEGLRLTELHIEANKGRVLADEDMKRLDQQHGTLVDRQDEVGNQLDDVQDYAHLTDEQQAGLDAALNEYAAPGDLTVLHDSFSRVRRHLSERLVNAHACEKTAADSLRRAFEAFQRLWPDPDLGTDARSYRDYRIILDGLEAEGLPQQREKFKRGMALWTGQDLVPLRHSLGEAIDRIEDRLAAVNDILANIPFGRDRDRLRISLRRLTVGDVRKFIQRLNRIAGGATTAFTDDEVDARFKEIASFIDTIRTSDTLPKGNVYTRDKYLDVHRHIRITAERVGTNGEQLSVYDSLGGKSGGETQELIAFIVGAALRYQLGDDGSSTRPRFAPVLLDEGFIKADAEFAQRSVGAWKRLGFQLVIGAPLDKVSGIEEHVGLVVGVNKPGNYSLINPLDEDSKPGQGTDRELVAP